MPGISEGCTTKNMNREEKVEQGTAFNVRNVHMYNVIKLDYLLSKWKRYILIIDKFRWEIMAVKENTIDWWGTAPPPSALLDEISNIKLYPLYKYDDSYFVLRLLRMYCLYICLTLFISWGCWWCTACPSV